MMVYHNNGGPPERQLIRLLQTRVLPVLFVFLMTGVIGAQPDMSKKYVVDSFVVYRDARIYNLFYYLPGDLKIATDREGKPDFRLLLMRYTGTRTYGDQGSQRFRNLLQMRVIHTCYSANDLRTIVQKLKAYSNDPVLKPMPVRNLRSVLVYSAAGIEGSHGNTIKQQDGHFSQENDIADRNEYWKERTFVLRLDNTAANILWNALQEQQTILSVGFAFYADVFNSLETDLNAYGNTVATGALDEIIRTEKEKAAADSLLDTRVVRAGAFEVIIDLAKWPDLVRMVDINEQIPPDYAAVDVYCYDFNNNLRPDLAQKKIEIEAIGVGGEKVTIRYTFRSDMPDIYVCDMKFPYAVKINVPYRYRITEITRSGVVSRKEWESRESWHEILDITSKSDN